MSTLIQINVTNNSKFLENFFFFQEPAKYTGGGQIYSNSLMSTPILPKSDGGSVYSFLLDLQYYAGVQQQVAPPVIGQPSGYTSAIRQIELTPAQPGTEDNSTVMSVTPALGLSPSANDPNVQAGAFRISAPKFDNTRNQYNGGSAVQLASGAVVLSNFVTVKPGQALDCQPVLKFYIGVGSYTSGTVMNFTGSSIEAALCDATDGYTTFNVTYNADGSWTVLPLASRLLSTANEAGRISVNSVPLNATIKNEAGTGIICQGYTNSFIPPVTIDHLTTPGVLHMHAEYQVGPLAGPYTGRMVTGLAPVNNSATFS